MCADAEEVARALGQGGASSAAAAALRVSVCGGDGGGSAAHAHGERGLLAAAGGDFEMSESVLALHATLLRLTSPPSVIADSILKTAAIARRSGQLPLAASLVASAAQMPISHASSARAEWEHAQVLHLFACYWAELTASLADCRSGEMIACLARVGDQ